jgi:DNA-binding IscR family transcriptional regulator
MTDAGKSSTKIDRQELYDELRRRADTSEPFNAADVAQNLGVAESVAAKHLLLLSADGFLERVEGGRYLAGPMLEIDVAHFLKELQAAAKNPQREKDLQDIARLKSNNDIMRERLVAATAEREALRAERDHYLGLLRQHHIDAGPPVAASVPVRAPAPAPVESPPLPAESELADGDEGPEGPGR